MILCTCYEVIWNEDLRFSPVYNASDRPFRVGTSDGFAGTLNRVAIDNSVRKKVKLGFAIEMIGLLSNLIH